MSIISQATVQLLQIYSISLYSLHLIAASNKADLQFFYCNFYIGLYMAKNVNRTARMQWKVDTIKNCIYLQCGLIHPWSLSEYPWVLFRMLVQCSAIKKDWTWSSFIRSHPRLYWLYKLINNYLEVNKGQLKWVSRTVAQAINHTPNI